MLGKRHFGREKHYCGQEDLCETATRLQGRLLRQAPGADVIRFEETGNVCRAGPKIDIGIGVARFICRKQSTLGFPFAKGPNVHGAVLLTLHANDPFFGHSVT